MEYGDCPCHVIGPLLSKTHFRPWSWQTRIGDMLSGYGHPRMFWNIVDVRDVATVQVLIAECRDNNNGQRYNLVAPDESGLIPQQEVQAHLQRLFPGKGIAGNYQEGRVFRSPVAVLEKVRTQLKLEPFTVEQTITANTYSLLSWGLAELHCGENNWQREDNDLSIPSSWNPHIYPAIDPALRATLEAEGKA